MLLPEKGEEENSLLTNYNKKSQNSSAVKKKTVVSTCTISHIKAIKPAHTST